PGMRDTFLAVKPQPRTWKNPMGETATSRRATPWSGRPVSSVARKADDCIAGVPRCYSGFGRRHTGLARRNGHAEKRQGRNRNLCAESLPGRVEAERHQPIGARRQVIGHERLLLELLQALADELEAH